jgi:hypothetical protein
MRQLEVFYFNDKLKKNLTDWQIETNNFCWSLLYEPKVISVSWSRSFRLESFDRDAYFIEIDEDILYLTRNYLNNSNYRLFSGKSIVKNSLENNGRWMTPFPQEIIREIKFNMIGV